MSTTAVPIQPIKSGSMTRLWAGLALLALLAIGLAWWGTSRPVAMKGGAAGFMSWNGWQPGVKTTASGLQYMVLDAGDGGAKPTDKDVAVVAFRAATHDGKVIGESEQPGPMPVKGDMKGLSEALKMMSKNAHYRFWLPPSLAYGASPPPGAPFDGESVLIFDVRMANFMSNEQYQQLQMQQQMMQQMQGGGMPGGPPGPGPM